MAILPWSRGLMRWKRMERYHHTITNCKRDGKQLGNIKRGRKACGGKRFGLRLLWCWFFYRPSIDKKETNVGAYHQRFGEYLKREYCAVLHIMQCKQRSQNAWELVDEWLLQKQSYLLGIRGSSGKRYHPQLARVYTTCLPTPFGSPKHEEQKCKE